MQVRARAAVLRRGLEVIPAWVGPVVAFLADHFDIIEAIAKAIAAGASKESIKAAIIAAEVEASDAVMREELRQG